MYIDGQNHSIRVSTASMRQSGPPPPSFFYIIFPSSPAPRISYLIIERCVGVSCDVRARATEAYAAQRHSKYHGSPLLRAIQY